MKITDWEWEKWGARDPYYGVYSSEAFQKENLDQDARKLFFQSGVDHVEHVISKIQRHIDPNFQPRTILDFGCGVGRLLIPFSRHAARVTGIDVSKSMLLEAQKNLEAFSINNVELIDCHDDDLGVIPESSFDLVHSYVVFQHIPVKRGERIFASMLARLREGGCGVIHVIYGSAAPEGVARIQRMKNWLRSHLPIVEWLICLRRDLAGAPPEMQMNAYHLNVLMMDLQAVGVKETFIELAPHGDKCGANFYFQKPGRSE